ncbi:hypothetical protein GPECTOR_9g629 [Gonium pectorale]|uniref:Uncharacterized protein n=1 Tax=Gonium pectorale TaxID=33097 RepID=A0A150GS39_GONPE|nr:hypothetical protein GPECTOR_9g629 [Gonium pectorale]|eukprot:KXZ52584.1 hypothetical protein GPECTOR_9g629 [Gonium pectorale]
MGSAASGSSLGGSSHSGAGGVVSATGSPCAPAVVVSVYAIAAANAAAGGSTRNGGVHSAVKRPASCRPGCTPIPSPNPIAAPAARASQLSPGAHAAAAGSAPPAASATASKPSPSPSTARSGPLAFRSHSDPLPHQQQHQRYLKQLRPSPPAPQHASPPAQLPQQAQPHLAQLMDGDDVCRAMQSLQLAAQIHDQLWASRRYAGGPGDVAQWEADMLAAGPMYDEAMRTARSIQHRALHSLVKQAVRRYVNPQRGAPEDVLRVILELLTGCGGAAAAAAAATTASRDSGGGASSSSSTARKDMQRPQVSGHGPQRHAPECTVAPEPQPTQPQLQQRRHHSRHHLLHVSSGASLEASGSGLSSGCASGSPASNSGSGRRLLQVLGLRG